MKTKLKTKINIVFILFSFQVNYSQVLIKLEYEKLNYLGHGIVMYYSLPNVNDLDDLVCKSKSFRKERNVLGSFGIPLTDYSENECEDKIQFLEKTKEVLKDNTDNRFQIKSESNSITLTIIKAKYEVCSFVPTFNYWGSYDGDFKICGIITTVPIIEKFDDLEMIIIKKIVKRLNKKV